MISSQFIPNFVSYFTEQSFKKECICLSLSIYIFEETSANNAEKRVMEDKEPDLEWEKDLRISDDTEYHWKEVEDEENEEKG